MFLAANPARVVTEPAFYFRSTNGGANWANGVRLYAEAVAPVETHGVSAQKPFHAGGKVPQRRLGHEMEMVAVRAGAGHAPRMKRFLLPAVFLTGALCLSPVAAREFFVAPDGSAKGEGSEESPWDLATALMHPAAAQPGDTIWLRGGTYVVEDPTTKLRGTEAAPIRVRQFPGERAMIDPGSPLTSLPRFFNDGAWTRFEDFGQVATFEWRAFGVAAADRMFPDMAPRRTREGTPQRGLEWAEAVPCKAGDPPLRLAFKNLPIGLYSVSVIGRVAVEKIPRVRRPLYVHLKINDGPRGEVSDYRMRVPYRDDYWEVTRIFFHAHRAGDFDAELYVGDGSLEELTIRAIELRDALAGCERRAIKKGPHFFSAAEREALRRGKDGAARPELPAEKRAALDARLWESFPPLNAMHHGSDSSCFLKQPNREHGRWELRKSNDGLPLPWVIENKTLGLVYTLEDYRAHRPLPAPYPWSDDGAGFYLAKQGSYFAPIAGAMFAQFGNFDPAALAERYHTSGDRAAARNGALMLARLALQWPATQLLYQEVAINGVIPDLDYNADWRFKSPRGGKIYYHGWSGGNWTALLKAYDQLFDFITGNDELATAIGRFVPWVKTPADVIQLFDVHLVQAGVQDAFSGAMYANLLPAAVVLGNDPVSVPWIDLSKSRADIHPLKGPWTDILSAGFNRDGTSYIGSWACYAPGTAIELFDLVRYLDRYRDAGGKPPFDFGNVRQFPKIAAAASSLFDGMIAGGYELAAGDASGETNVGRDVLSMRKGDPISPAPGTGLNYRYTHFLTKAEATRAAWRATRDWRFAWVLKNLLKRQFESDAEWAEIEGAAHGRRDPKLATVSRVMGGFGMGILEAGSESDDFRQKRALTLRTGTGDGHQHQDALDLNLWAHGCRMGTDHGSRCEGHLWTSPASGVHRMHNVVVVDEPGRKDSDEFAGADAWIETFKPLAGAQYMSGAAVAATHRDVEVYRRDAALIDVARSADSYVFDVVRVRGGKRHTWVFHGCDSDDFKVNAPLAPAAGADAEYLKEHLDTGRLAGTAGEVVEATWQLRRKAEDIRSAVPEKEGVINLPNAERNMLGRDYDEAAPRKFTRVRLFGHGGEKLLVGSPFSVAYNFAFPFLHVQTDAQSEAREANFPAIIEPFAGEPFITATKVLLREKGALGAVALEVRTRGGQTDICFSDGDPAAPVALPGDTAFAAEFAYASRDKEGLRVLELVGGRSARTADASIEVERAEWTAKISSVDYAALTLTVDAAFPASLRDEQAHIFNERHHTSYRITRAEPRGTQTVLTYDRAPDLGQSRIVEMEGQRIRTELPYRLEYIPNRRAGLTATGEAQTAFWKFTRGKEDATYQLEGRAPTRADFPDTDRDGRSTLRIYDFGPGDTIRIPVHAQLARKAPQLYELIANAPCTVTLPAGSKLTISRLHRRDILAAGFLPDESAAPPKSIPTVESDGRGVATITADDLAPPLRTSASIGPL